MHTLLAKILKPSDIATKFLNNKNKYSVFLPLPGLARVTGGPALAEDKERMVRAGGDAHRTAAAASLLAEAQQDLPSARTLI